MVNFFLTLLLLCLSLVFITLFVLFYKHTSHFSGANLPPGNIGYPVIGETIEFLSTGWKGHPKKFIFHRMTKFHPKVFKTSLLGEPAAVFCGSASNKFLFSNENKLVTTWWPSSVNKVFPSSRQTSAQSEAKKLRKLLPNFMKPEALNRYVGVMDAIAQRHFAVDWDREKGEILTFPLAQKYTLWLAARLFVSLENPAEIKKFEDPFQVLASGIFSMPIDVPGTQFHRAVNAAKFIRKELLEIIKRRKVELAEGKASPTQDILSHMLLTCTDDGRYMDESEIADKILGLLTGGHDTASAACTFIVKYLAELPHVYEAVYEEQMEIAKSKAAGELLNWEDLQKMKYSWNVAQEVLRLAPPLQGTFREAIKDFVFNGFSIPKGWKLYWSTNSTHKNPAYFPDPEKFDPSCFEGTGPAPYTFVPFGGGPRMCPGKEYARLEILVFMHNLVKSYKWEMILVDEKIIVDPTPIPAKGLPIRLIPHTHDG